MSKAAISEGEIYLLVIWCAKRKYGNGFHASQNLELNPEKIGFTAISVQISCPQFRLGLIRLKLKATRRSVRRFIRYSYTDDDLRTMKQTYIPRTRQQGRQDMVEIVHCPGSITSGQNSVRPTASKREK